MTTYIDVLKKANVSFQHYAVVSKEKGAQYRRISVEIVLHGAFDEFKNENTTKINNNIDKQPPEIYITSPNISRGFKPVSEDKKILITGVVTDKSGVNEVIINDEEVNMQSNGVFSHTVLLAVGDNLITVIATDTKRNTITKEFTIERTPKKTEPNIVNDDVIKETGKYYALIIGVSEYDDSRIPDLNNEPIKDAKELQNVLTQNYTFETENIRLLLNPTRKQIIRAFNEFEKIITEQDNFLIFYAGHGDYDENNKIGYWIPADAELGFTDGFLYNSTLVNEIKKNHSKHTLLIADACFSGSIFKLRKLPKDANKFYQNKYDIKSRNAITSGTLKTVPNESIFFDYLIDRLKNNTQKYMSASELFGKIEIPITNNSDNVPQFGDIQNVGHEGGDFIFIRKD